MVHVGIDYLPRHYVYYVQTYGLEVSPRFQRGHVWTPEQKVRFVEYMLRGGVSGLDIYINCPSWNRLSAPKEDRWCVLVDGKQRLDATLGFLNNEFAVFGGSYYRDFTDRLRITHGNFRWHVNDLATWHECLHWYLEMNVGGTAHTDDEINRVRAMLSEPPPAPRTKEEVCAQAGLDRDVLQAVLREVIT